LVMHVRRDAKNGGKAEECASPTPLRSGVSIWLRVVVTTGGQCRFSASGDGRSFTELGEAFQAQPGVWVGAKVGLFAATTMKPAHTGYADWDFFRVEG
jgi:hypothetical protein